MKSFVFIIAFVFGVVLSGLAQTTNIIEWQTTCPAGGTNNIFINQFNLPAHIGLVHRDQGIGRGGEQRMSSRRTWWLPRMYPVHLR